MKISICILLVIVSSVISSSLITIFWLNISFKIIDKKNIKLNKFVEYFNLCDRWMTLRERNIKIEQFFLNYNYNKIAVYGMGKIGQHFLSELENSKIEVAYAIDSKETLSGVQIPVYSLKENLPDVDVIVVTPIFEYHYIYHKIEEVLSYKIVSLDDVVYELFKQV